MHNSKIFAQLNGARTTQSGMGTLNDLAMDLLYAVRSTSALPTENPVRETREGVPVRPQQPSGAVFTCFITRGAIRARDTFVKASQQCIQGLPYLRRPLLALVNVV